MRYVKQSHVQNALSAFGNSYWSENSLKFTIRNFSHFLFSPPKALNGLLRLGMEYFRVPVFCDQTAVMSDPGGIVCLCGKALDLAMAWQRTAAGADSQCVLCQRCYDSRGQLISALRPNALRPLPRTPQPFEAFAPIGLRSSALWTQGVMPLVPPALAPAAMPCSKPVAISNSASTQLLPSA